MAHAEIETYGKKRLMAVPQKYKEPVASVPPPPCFSEDDKKVFKIDEWWNGFVSFICGEDNIRFYCPMTEEGDIGINAEGHTMTLSSVFNTGAHGIAVLFKLVEALRVLGCGMAVREFYEALHNEMMLLDRIEECVERWRDNGKNKENGL